MARPLSFDRDASLEAAMILFWQRGYQACALPDLLSAMNISRSSLYASFGDKRQLFMECLELFFQRTFKPLCQIQGKEANEESTYSLQSIENFFHYTLLQVPEHRRECGCLLVNTILEMAEQDQQLSQLAAKKLVLVETYFQECFKRAIDAGELQGEAESLAKLCMTLNQGLRVACRQGRSLAELENILQSSLQALGIKQKTH